MAAARALLIYLAAVFLGAALIAPWAWHGMQALAEHFPSLRHTAGQPFHRYVNRCLLVLAIGGLWPLVKSLRIRSGTELGWKGPWLRGLGYGFALGFLALGAVTVIGLLAGARQWVPPADTARWLRRLGTAALSAGVVACLEETLFRGVLFAAFRRSIGFVGAAFVTSALYSWVHFFERPPQPDQVDAWTGFWTLGRMLRGFTDPAALVPGWLSLAVAGGCLALARERTGSLAVPMGLHAGWIFWLKAYGLATTDVAGANARIWGTGRLFDGWLAFGLLAGQAIVLHLLLRPKPKTS